MISHWFHAANDFAQYWLPLAFFAVLILTLWLLWKMVGMLPRVKPARSTRARSRTSRGATSPASRRSAPS